MNAGGAAMASQSRQTFEGNSEASSAAGTKVMPAATPAKGVGILMAAAGLLILLGLMAQFGELGLGPFTRNTLWIIPFLAQGLWNILVALLSRTALANVLPFWPLALVLAGCAALYLLSQEGRTPAAQDSSRRSDHVR